MTVPRVVALLAIGLLCHELRGQCEVSQVSGTLSVGDRDFGTSVSLDSDVLVVGDFVSPAGPSPLPETFSPLASSRGS
jgi:hypothetical protein